MIEALQEEKKLTLKLYTNVRKTSFFDYYDDEKPEDQMHNVDELNRLLEKNKDANLIDIYINSPGGDVSEGITIYNILKRNKAYKRVYIDGFACSIASVIAMAGNAIYMPKTSMMMVHNCWSMAVGNARELRKQADDLDKINELGIAAYMSKFNGSEKELRKLLDEETYLTAQECLDKGLCTKIIDDNEKTEKIVEEALEQQTKIYNAKLKQLRAIQECIRSIEVETEPHETVKETKEVETVNEMGNVNETKKIEDIPQNKAYTKEEIKNSVEQVKENALRSFFHVA
mgnify:FL=1